MTTITEKQKRKVLDKVEESFALAEKHFGRKFPRPTVNFDIRGRTAGISYGNTLLRFNPTIYDGNQDEFLRTVVPHEVAHQVCANLYGRPVHHELPWRQVMQNVYKLSPDTTHTFLVKPSRKIRKWVYICECENVHHHITSVKHFRIKEGRRNYICTMCKTRIKILPGQKDDE